MLAVVFASLLFGQITNEPTQLFSEKEIAKAVAYFPTTEEAIERFKGETLAETSRRLAAFKVQAKASLSFDSVVVGWHHLVEYLFAKRVALGFTFLTSSEEAVRAKGEKAAEELSRELFQLCKDQEALGIVLAYAEQVNRNPNLITPSQKGWLKSLLETAAESSTPLQQKAEGVLGELSKQAILNYTYQKGEAKEKVLPEDKRVAIINWNVCFFHYDLSMLFGGVLPWQVRIDRVAEEVRRQDADLVCLQEVFSQEAAEQLYQKLKGEYAHFYINIGPKLCGFDLFALGIPSGLFVASKYPLGNPVFTPFDKNQTPKVRGYGFFTCEILSENRPFAVLTTTHLHPGNDVEDVRFRERQVNAILESLKAKASNGIPSFLCGDLNIERDGETYKKLTQGFINNYEGPDWTCCELRNYWWRAGQNAQLFEQLGLELEWVDYFMRLKEAAHHLQSVKTRIVPVNNPSQPQNALSDHQLMHTIITFK
jgi:endonuclease/exonuclease/phosphatase family metal-dependent hydrolase